MYIPVIILIIIVIIYFYDKRKPYDEIPSLRDNIGDLNNYNDYEYNESDEYKYDDSLLEKEEIKNKKYEYTYQESQDRSKLGVLYNAPVEDIKRSYYKIVREHNLNPQNNTYVLSEIHLAYKRLVEIEASLPKKETIKIKKILRKKNMMMKTLLLLYVEYAINKIDKI